MVDSVERKCILISNNFVSNGLDVNLEEQEDRGLLALQGPESARVLQPLVSNFNLTKLTFMTSVITSLAGIEKCRITRCG